MLCLLYTHPFSVSTSTYILQMTKYELFYGLPKHYFNGLLSMDT